MSKTRELHNGFCCPYCRTRLRTKTTRHPCPNKTFRYLECATCPYRVKTEENVVPMHLKKPKGK